MSLQSAIYALLTGDATINTTTSGRIYPVLIAQDAGYPAIAFTLISEFPVSALANDTTLHRARVQIDLVDEQDSYDDLKALGDNVLTLLQRYEGTIGGTTIVDVDLDNRAEDFDENTRIFTDRFDFMFTYRG